MNDAFGTFGIFGGLQITTDRNLTVKKEDWSDVRSPSRAARRRKRGFPQRIRIIQVPSPTIYQIGGKYVMHPETLKELRRKMQEQFP